MAFILDSEDELDLDTLLEDVVVPDANLYISDGNKAVELLAKLIRNERETPAFTIKKIRKNIDQLFSIVEDIGLENGLELYEQFLDLCARLSASHKIQKIQDKVVISFGGAFSAGKSKFINSISGMDNILPVAQAPTTSIPTFIIHSDNDMMRANSVYGYSTELTYEQMNALTHEFYDTYGIGFSSFVDSIIVESTRYSLPNDIALMDTPGYTKYDEKNDSKLTLSDRQRAFEQLRASDYLIWLIDIESGAVTQDDISFIESLRIKTPILIVFTKADLKTELEISSIVRAAKETIDKTSIQCFGITAYSSNQRFEYGDHLIPKFINFAIGNSIRGNDIVGEFDKTEREMRKRINHSLNDSVTTARTLFKYITRSKRFLDIRALVALWGKENQKSWQLSNMLKQYEDYVRRTRQELIEFVKRSE